MTPGTLYQIVLPNAVWVNSLTSQRVYKSRKNCETGSTAYSPCSRILGSLAIFFVHDVKNYKGSTLSSVTDINCKTLSIGTARVQTCDPLDGCLILNRLSHTDVRWRCDSYNISGQ